MSVISMNPNCVNSMMAYYTGEIKPSPAIDNSINKEKNFNKFNISGHFKFDTPSRPLTGIFDTDIYACDINRVKMIMRNCSISLYSWQILNYEPAIKGKMKLDTGIGSFILGDVYIKFIGNNIRTGEEAIDRMKENEKFSITILEWTIVN